MQANKVTFEWVKKELLNLDVECAPCPKNSLEIG